MLDDERLDALDVGRQIGAEPGQLMCDERDEQHQREDKGEDKKGEDQDGRTEPSETKTLQPAGDGIEHIGQRHPGHEGQQNLTQNVERERDDSERCEPEPDLSLDRHALACLLDFVRHSQMGS